tara:strand:+ start:5246 stop:7879 length:2634 start_codon:yes stop_codon:yes gene_type:complete
LAKIVPQGSVVNMGLSDPMDRLVQTVDLVTKVGSFLQTSADRANQNHMNDLNSILDVMSKGSQFLNKENALNIQNLANQVTSDAQQSGEPIIQMAANIVNESTAGAVANARNYDAAYLKFTQLKNTPLSEGFGSIFDINSYTVKNQDGTTSMNQQFLDEINNMGADKWNQIVRDMNSIEAQLFNRGPKNQLTPKITNHKASQNLVAEWNSMQDIWLNLRDSADMNNQISNEEFKYMISKGGLSNTELEKLREQITSIEKQNIGSYSRNIASSNKALLSLTQKKDKTIRELMEEDEDDLFVNLLKQYVPDEATRDAMKDKTIGELELGGALNIDGEFTATPAGVKSAYDKLIQELKISKQSFQTDLTLSKKRFNFWSPFTWDAEISVIEDDGSGSGIKFKGGPDTPTKIQDTDNDGVPDFIDRDSGVGGEEFGGTAGTSAGGTDTEITEFENQEKEQKGETFSEYYPSGTIDFIKDNYGKIGTAGAATAAIYYSDKLSKLSKDLISTYRLPTNVVQDFLSDKNGLVKKHQTFLNKYDAKINKIKNPNLTTINKEIELLNKKINNIKENKTRYFNNIEEPEKMTTRNKIALDGYDKEIKKQEKILEKKNKKLNAKITLSDANKIKINKLEKLKKGKGESFIKSYARKTGSNPADIRKLLDEGAKTKWVDLLKTRTSLGEKFGKNFDKVKSGGRWVGGKYLPFRIGQEIGSYLGMGDKLVDQMIAGGTGIAAAQGFKKFLEKKAPQLLTKTAQDIAPSATKTIVNWATKKMPKKIATRLVASLGVAGASGPGAPIVSTVAGLINAGLLVHDISNLAYTLYENREINKEQRDYMIQAGNMYYAYDRIENPKKDMEEIPQSTYKEFRRPELPYDFDEKFLNK